MRELRRTVGGVELEAVRMRVPVPHWRIKVAATGYLFESGVFSGCHPLKDVWANVDRTAKARGSTWQKETLEAR